MQSSKFAMSMGRGKNSHDPELDDMREELDMYQRKEYKEEIRKILEERRKKFQDELDEDERAKAARLQVQVDKAGFVIDDTRSKK